MATLVQVTPDSSLEELEVCLTYLVEEARNEARRGFVGVRGARYADLHANIDLLLDARLVAQERS